MQRQAFVEQFELNAHTRPDAAAVEGPGGSVSYDSLNRQANRIAHALIGLGAKPDSSSIVGLFLEPSADYVAALLGTAKSSSVFLPLPPDLPEQRLANYLNKAGVDLLITDTANRALLEERLAACGRQARVVLADD